MFITKRDLSSFRQILLMASLFLLSACSVDDTEAANKWVTGYLPAYAQGEGGSIPFMEDADWKMLTHAIHNSATVEPDGTLNMGANHMLPENRAAAIREAHHHGVPILFGLSGWITKHREALDSPESRTRLVQATMKVLQEGYDGVDVDLEPLTDWGKEKAGNPGYVAFINELHSAMQTYKPPLADHPLLMAAILARDCVVMKDLQGKFDQINLMLYDMAGTWEGMTWHDSALYSGKDVYAGTSKPVASVDREVKGCLDAGLPRTKLGLGINLETRLWIGGVTEPRQTWEEKPKHFMTSDGVPKESYAILLDKYYKSEYYHWDESAQMPYLTIDKPGEAEDMFISFNDERSVVEKVRYMKQSGLSGLMIWSMQLDYRANQPEGQRRPIMQTIREQL